MVTRIINEWRIDQGLGAYRESKTTCEIATARLPEIQQNFSHDGFYKYPPQYTSSEPISENLGSGYTTSDDVNTLLTDWLSSPSHSKVLKDRYTRACIKCANGYCVQIFANF